MAQIPDSVTLMSQSRQRHVGVNIQIMVEEILDGELSSGNESSSSIRHVSFITLKHTKLS